MDGANPIVLEIGIEVVKAILAVIIPAVTVALSFSFRRLNQKLQKKSVRDEIYRQLQLAKEVQTFKSMNFGKQADTLLESMKAFVISNEIAISDVELKLLVERALASERNLKMRFLQMSRESEE